MHAWDDPFEQVLRLASEHGIPVATPIMGERIDLTAPRKGQRWWHKEVAQP